MLNSVTLYTTFNKLKGQKILIQQQLFCSTKGWYALGGDCISNKRTGYLRIVNLGSTYRTKKSLAYIAFKMVEKLLKVCNFHVPQLSYTTNMNKKMCMNFKPFLMKQSPPAMFICSDGYRYEVLKI